MDDADYVTNRVTLDVGQALLLYTDGLVEGRAHPGSVERLGDRGLHELLAGLSPTDLLRPQRVIQAANDRHGSNLPDDVALLVVMGPDSAEASGIPDGVRPLTA